MSGDPYNSVGERAAPKNVVKMPGSKAPPAVKSDHPLWTKIRKIVRMGGWNSAVKIDAVQVLGSCLEKANAGRVKTVMVSIEWDDGSFSTDWCQMPRRCLLGHSFNVQTTVQDEVDLP